MWILVTDRVLSLHSLLVRHYAGLLIWYSFSCCLYLWLLIRARIRCRGSLSRGARLLRLVSCRDVGYMICSDICNETLWCCLDEMKS